MLPALPKSGAWDAGATGPFPPAGGRAAEMAGGGWWEGPAWVSTGLASPAAVGGAAGEPRSRPSAPLPPQALHCLQGTCRCRRSGHRLVCFCGGPRLLPPEWEDRRARSVCVHCPIPSSCRPRGMRGLRREGGGGGQLAPPGVTPARLRRVVVWGPVNTEIRLQEPPLPTPALAVGPAWLCTPGCCPEQGPL